MDVLVKSCSWSQRQKWVSSSDSVLDGLSMLMPYAFALQACTVVSTRRLAGMATYGLSANALADCQACQEEGRLSASSVVADSGIE